MGFYSIDQEVYATLCMLVMHYNLNTAILITLLLCIKLPVFV
jgi:hypothetical protein